MLVTLAPAPIGRAQAPPATAPARVIVLVRADDVAASALAAHATSGPLAAHADGKTRNAWRGRRDAALLRDAERRHRPARDRVAAFVEAHGGRVTHRFRLMPGLSAILPPELVERLRRHPDVVSVREDRQRRPLLSTLPATLGLAAFANVGITAGSVDVAMIDTGIFLDHPGLKVLSDSGRIVSLISLAQACPNDDCGPENPLEDPTSPDDFVGHGTAVAGVIASAGWSGHAELKGVVPGLRKLINVKAFTDPGHFDSDVISGAEMALDLGDDAPEVINASLGAVTYYLSDPGEPDLDEDPYDHEDAARFFDAVVATAHKVMVVAAGNLGPSAQSVESPGIAYNVLSVGATDTNHSDNRADDQVWSGSARGPAKGPRNGTPLRKKPDLVAPGYGLFTTGYLGGVTTGSDEPYAAVGTSLAAPVVSGLAALLWDTPDLGAPAIAEDDKPLAIRAVLINSAEDRGAPGWDPDWGWGYVDAARAYAERGGVAIGEIAAAGARRLYLRSSASATKATLVWNRPVTFTSTPPLKNLDLRLYALAGGQLRASSASTVDNVEQVASATAEGVVLAVEGNDTFGAGDATAYALAHGGGFVPAQPPQLAATLIAPGQVGAGALFLVTATFANPATAPALPVAGGTATLTLPPGYTVDPSTPLARSLPTVAAGASAQVQWVVRAPAVPDPAPVTLAALGSTAAFAIPLSAGAVGSVQTTAACSFAVTPATFNAPAGGASTSIAVTTAPGCGWLAASSAPWAAITTPASGVGTGAFGIIVAANASGQARQATIVVGGATLTITQPPTERTYYLAEGATGPFFDLDIAVANPNDAPVNAEVTFLNDEGQTHSMTVPLGPKAQRIIRVNDVPGLEAAAVSTVVKSPGGAPLIVERTMFWDRAGYYGGHGGSAVDGPRTKWYFAEGSQGFFDTYVLLANATDTPAQVTVTFLLDAAGAAPVEVAVPVAAHARKTIWAGDYATLVDRAFSIVVEADVPVIAERAMYFGQVPFWAGGHESAGVPALATTWFHAEGATGDFFDEYILIGNPGTTAATLTLTFLLDDGRVIQVQGTLPGERRMTVNVETVADDVALGRFTLLAGDPALLRNAQVSTTVTSTVPVISERAMYWSGDFTSWYEAHNSFGVTQTAVRWGLAEGRTGGPLGFDTYILLANPNASPVAVEVTLLRQGGRPPLQRTFTVPATSRFNVQANIDPIGADPGWGALGLQPGEAFGAIVRSLDPSKPIAVERAMYWFGHDALFWTGGTNATAVPLP